MNPILKFTLLLCTVTVCTTARAQQIPPLIPQPRSMVALSGDPVRLSLPQALEIRRDAPPSWNEERYMLRIGPEGATIRARTEQGVAWALRTLEQLRLEDGSYPCVAIDDYPEFRIRAFMYDTGRNFVPVDQLKRYIDLTSAYKLNTFHWHLTDHPAWRIECRCHPRLNDPRHQRPGRNPGAYYTYDQIRDVIAYARERGVRVIPEIDMPGHSTYFNAAFGFAMDSPEGMRVLEECIREFFAEIPASSCPLIHIGSDEVHIADPEGFMQWAQRIGRSDGRKVIVWDPGLPADEQAIRQVWRTTTAQEAESWRAPYLDSSMGYLNYYDPLLFPYRVFCHAPGLTGRGSDRALGGILCMWNDVRIGDPARIHLQNGMMAGVLPFAERFWNGGCIGDSSEASMEPAGSRTAALFEAFQQKMRYHKRHRLAEEMAYWEPVHPTEWEVTLTAPGDTVRTVVCGDAIDLDALCREHGLEALPIRCRAVRRFYAPSDTLVAFRTGFEAPARSNRISDGIAAQGLWENEGEVLVNGTPVAPPAWQESGRYRFHFNTWGRPEEEYPYTDEQLYWMRTPIEIRFRQGQNTVELRLAKHFAGQRFHMGFVPVEP